MLVTDISHATEIFSVSQLNRETRLLIEGSFPFVWVEGEISNFAAPYSGHWYFTLKDQHAQVRCAMFKIQNKRLGFTLKDGMNVILKAKVSFYEGRGEFQLIAEHVEEAGVGQLQKAFEALKKRLAEQGLFESVHKKLLPLYPKKIGIITSQTGAAIRDILHVLKRRFPCAPIILYPTLVQGDLAAPNIVKAIKIANQRQECDVLLLARGGGSLEDLWAFNEECVAFAIFQSTIPIVSGIGHEIDFTIADFVADVRAPTPSAAAELISPNSQELLTSLIRIKNTVIRLIQQKLTHHQQYVDWSVKQLQQQHPKHKLLEQRKHLTHFESTLIRLQLSAITKLQATCLTLASKLKGHTPLHTIKTHKQHLISQKRYLENDLLNLLQLKEQTFLRLASTLETLSPLSTLKRGFAIATTQNQHVIRSSRTVKSGEKIHIRLMEGALLCTVDDIEPQ